MSYIKEKLNIMRFRIDEIRWSNLILFAPGIFLIVTGVASFIRPSLLMPLLATFCVLLGLAALVVGWKLIVLRTRVEHLARRFEGQVNIQGIRIQPEPFTESEPSEQKKIVYH